MKLRHVSRQAHAAEFHDDGRNEPMSYVNSRGKSDVQCLLPLRRENGPFEGPRDAKAPALPRDGSLNSQCDRAPKRGAPASVSKPRLES